MSARRNQGPSSLVFDIDVSSDFGSLGAGPRGLSESGSMEEIDCFRSLAMEQASDLCAPASKLEEHIKSTVQSLWPEECLGVNGTPQVSVLRDKLADQGYQVLMVGDDHQKAKNGREAWQQLRHSFLLCFGVLGPGGVTFCYQQVPCIIDPRFKEQFEIAHPSPLFEALLKTLPNEYVGNPESLRQLVHLISEEMAKAFLEQKLSVPPWRNPKAMATKWAGPIAEYLKDQNHLPIIPGPLQDAPVAPGTSVSS